MRGELIALDLETTGLDPNQDAILEIAAVRFRDGNIVEEFSTLVDPQRPIPQIVTQITGLTDDDVVGAPRIAQAIPRLIAFAGSAPIIAHNIISDVGFLNKVGALQTNLRLDTYELSATLLPRAPRYTLGALAAYVGVDLVRAHRALDDARATALLYWVLWQRACGLPRELLEEIIALSQPFRWEVRPILTAALEFAQPGAAPLSPPPPVYIDQPFIPSLPASSLTAAVVFADDGLLAQKLADFELRDGQRQMAAIVEEAMVSSRHLIVEAATGIGKTYAYLAPALAQAANGERVLISTSTLTLQDQLIDKDIPTLQAALGTNVQAAVMKGRVNYLCPRRMAALRARGPVTLEELQLLAKLLIWQHETNSGDKRDITLRGMENQGWARLSAAEENCTDATCESIGGHCPFNRARKAAQAARIVVVNHALLVADSAQPQSALPDCNIAIIDEAHQLEEVTTQHETFSIDAPALRARLRELGGDGRAVLIDALLKAVRAALPENLALRFADYGAVVRDAVREMSVHATTLFNAVESMLADWREQRPDVQTFRITDEIRRQSSFEQAQAAWRTLADFMNALAEKMSELGAGLRRMSKYPIQGRLDLASACDAAARFFTITARELQAFFVHPDPNGVYWLGTGYEERGATLNTAPAHIGKQVESRLWSAKRSVIMTGATLQTAGSFDFIRDRLAAQNIDSVSIPSPFDMKRAVLHYQISDLPDPADRARYQTTVERAIIDLAMALEGRLLVLFTSFAQLRQTSQAITGRLALGNIAVYDSLDAGGRGAAIDSFKVAPRAVLIGTRSFWEGIDLPVDTLRGVVIVRLPFSVPTDPIFAARGDRYSDSFNDYSLPDAILKFRQGFGRLIRRSSDRGVFVVLDGRLTGKKYGQAFLDSLPVTTRISGNLASMGAAVSQWFTDDVL
jgi:DNA polymerase-3 subunit epsilon/ATP-dependent DNA helicase DinG